MFAPCGSADNKEEQEIAVYVVNDVLYDMIKAAWELYEAKYTLVAGPPDEE
jgi:hypothetical protein